MRKYLFYNDQPEGDDDDPHKDCGQKTEEIINSEEDGQVDVQRAKEYPRDAGKALQQYMYKDRLTVNTITVPSIKLV